MTKRLLLESALLQAVHGAVVLVVVSRGSDIPDLMGSMGADELAESGAKVRRANGDQRIEFPGGGRIRFSTVQGVMYGSLRGMTAHHVYLPFSTLNSEALCTELLPSLNGRVGATLSYSGDVP